TRQTPAPSQVRALVSVDMPVGHDGATHWVPARYFWQPALPSQSPLLAQVDWAAAVQIPFGSGEPAAMLVHVPSDADRLHVWQLPLQALLQQTPWAQKLETHSLAAAQVLPSPFRPQDPALHTAGGAQSASAVQVFLHALVPQRNGKHELDVVGR